MREVIDLSDNLVEPIDLLDHDFVKVLPEICVLKALRQELGKGLDRDERVPDFVRHARGEIGPKGCAIDEGPAFAAAFLPR